MSVWSNLKFATAGSARSILGGVGYRWINGNQPLGDLKFKSKPASKIVTARVAQQIAMQMAEGELNRLFSRLQNMAAKKIREDALKVSDKSAFAKLIKGGEIAEFDYGTIQTAEGDNVTARDYLSRKVPEALIMSYTGDSSITYSFPKSIKSESYKVKKQSLIQSLIETNRSIEHNIEYEDATEVTSKDVIHIDLTPQVTFATSKNLVMTPVQGRDSSRKELISNGDLTFTINGSVATDLPGVYPAAAVQRLIKMSQYKGIIQVHHFIFDQFKVKQVIIKDFSLQQQEYKNIQPYSMTCVAIEADEITLINDTIGRINEVFEASPANFWYNLILNNKLAEIAAGAAVGAANTALSKGLDIEGMVTNV